MDFRRIRREAPESFVMLSGDDANAIPMMALGGEGLISVIGNAYPGVWAEAMDLALFGSVKEAEQHLAVHRSMMDVLFAEGNPTGIKAVCDLLGLCGPSPRMPLMPALRRPPQGPLQGHGRHGCVPNRPIQSSDA